MCGHHSLTPRTLSRVWEYWTYRLQKVEAMTAGADRTAPAAKSPAKRAARRGKAAARPGKRTAARPAGRSRKAKRTR
jgi:hypothetical protein